MTVQYLEDTRPEEQAVRTYQLASYTERAMAGLVDGLLTICASLVLITFGRQTFATQPDFLMFLTLLIIYSVPLFYYHLSVAIWGSPLGKVTFGLKVLKTNGSLPTFLTAALRYSLNSFTLILLFFFSVEMLGIPMRKFDQSGLLGFLSALCTMPMLLMVSAEGFLALFNPQRQTLHDELAGTIVIKTGSLQYK